MLNYLHEVGVVYANTLEPYLDAAMQQHKAYDALSYLIELGLDITRVGKIPLAYKERYPLFTDMWERRCSDLFVYTVYLATEVYPKAEGKRKEEILKNVAALSSLPYVIQKSEEQTHGH
ncbi:MAG TPA: hypothetical protein ENK72_01130 [Epsilonproteobacteria bacterium]|nr:hypothetical protein [Campylobacterota bacterium]